MSIKEKFNIDKDTEFAAIFNITKQELSAFKTGVRPVSDKYILKAIEIFDKVDANWLIKGEDSILVSEMESIIQKRVSNLENEVKIKEEKIQGKIEVIEVLRESIKSKDMLIERLIREQNNKDEIV